MDELARAAAAGVRQILAARSVLRVDGFKEGHMRTFTKLVHEIAVKCGRNVEDREILWTLLQSKYMMNGILRLKGTLIPKRFSLEHRSKGQETLKRVIYDQSLDIR